MNCYSPDPDTRPNASPEAPPTNHGEAAERLWQLLDDIDTLSDAIKPSDEEGYRTFFKRAMYLAGRRTEIAQSFDGHTLTWRWEPAPETEPRPPVTPTEAP